MSRELYESLFRQEAARGEGADAEAVAALAEAAATWRSWRADSLAQAEFVEGTWVEEVPVEQQVLRLAADDLPQVAFPARYVGDGWSVVVGLGADGRPYVALDAGRGPAWLDLGGGEVELAVGHRAPLAELEAPPAVLELRDEAGKTWTLPVLRPDE